MTLDSRAGPRETRKKTFSKEKLFVSFLFFFFLPRHGIVVYVSKSLPA